MMDKTEAAELIREALKALGPDAAGKMLAEAAGKPQQEEKVRASEPVAIYAQQDIVGPDGKVLHPRGHMQRVYPVDAREIVRKGLYAYTDPGPAPRVAPTPAAPAEAGGTGTAPVPAGEGAPAGDTAGAPAEFTLMSLPGVNEKLARVLEDNKLGTVAQLRAAGVEGIAAVPNVGNKLAERIVDHLDKHYPKEG